MKNLPCAFLLGALTLGAAATAADESPAPASARAATTPTAAQLRAVYDLKALNIGTTGSPSYIPVFTFKNAGTKPITETVRFWYKFEGTLVTWKNIPPSQPGEAIVVKGDGADGGFGRYGYELEVFADCDEKLKEKDENNNRLKKKLVNPYSKPIAAPKP